MGAPFFRLFRHEFQTAIFVVALLYDEEPHARHFSTSQLCFVRAGKYKRHCWIDLLFSFHFLSLFPLHTYFYKNPWMVMNEELKKFSILVLFRKQFLFLGYKKYQKMPYVSTVLWSCTFEKWDISSLEWDEVVKIVKSYFLDHHHCIRM